MKERNRDVWCDLDKRTLRRLLPGTIEEEPQTWKKKSNNTTFNTREKWRKYDGEKEIVKKEQQRRRKGLQAGVFRRQNLLLAPRLYHWTEKRTTFQKNQSNGYFAIASSAEMKHFVALNLYNERS